MGMDYRYAGSASYPRYEEEIVKIAAVFDGRETKEIHNYHEKCLQEPHGYWFGYMFPREDEDIPKFVFPEGTNPLVVKWLNHPYDDMPSEEIEVVWEEIQKHPEIEAISYQIWYELRHLNMYHEMWSIS